MRPSDPLRPDGARRLTDPLYLRHRLATSRLAAPISSLRSLWRSRRLVRHPELGLLLSEDAVMAGQLKRMIRADWNCLDVGAHLGSMSYLFSQLAGAGQHAMIEASPAKAAMLARRFPAWDVFGVAVSEREENVTFYENLDAPGFSSLTSRDHRGRVREITVASRRIDTLLGPDRDFDLIKIDVEGFEYAALKGAENLLQRCRPVILFEAGAVNDPDVDSASYEALYAMLTDDFGYRIYAGFDLQHNRPPISAETFNSYRRYPYLAFNYFALHPKRHQALCNREV